MITQTRLKELLNYDSLTGLFTWKVNRGSSKIGDICEPNTKGYIIITIDNIRYYAHTLAWLYVYGEYRLYLDHKDKIRSHNAIDNLRKASYSQNNFNTRKYKGKYLKGAHKVRNRFQARINVNGEAISLGYFDTEQEAHEAYCKASKELHGDFGSTE